MAQNNTACTHITCPKWDKMYCYVCEKPKGNLNPGIEDQTFTIHNANWKTDPNRCPMYLHEICQRDSRYTSDPKEALETFHNILVLQSIKKLFKKYKDNDFKELYSRYKQVEADKIDLNEAKNGDLVLIKRS